jgi:imidazolonepropionase-like amidohydrolase
MLGAAALLWSQAAPTTTVRAGKLFDPISGRMLANQVVLIQGERITGVGPAASVSIPAGAKVIDLSRATVLPGLIDGHLHLTNGVGGLQYQMMVALHNATESLKAGYTTQVVQGSHGGGYADVELKRAIDRGWCRGRACCRPGPSWRSRPLAPNRILWSSNRSRWKLSGMAQMACARASANWPVMARTT